MTDKTNAELIAEVEAFLSTVYGSSEMNVVRGVRKVLAGESTSFTHEVRLSVYGAPCGHTPPAHYPKGYGACIPCRYGYDELENENDRW